MRDLGKTGHIEGKQTALLRFLDAVKRSHIPRGSYLIVESFDRLSRQKVWNAYNQFNDIIRAGITLVTLTDGMEYSQEKLEKGNNWFQLVISIVYMARAWEESDRKSGIAKDDWNKRRKKAHEEGKRISNQCPKWLEPNDNPNNLPKDNPLSRFDVIPKAEEAIQHIFKLAKEGHGKNKIARIMNEKKIWMPPERDNNETGQWNQHYISRILSNQAVIGHNLPHLHKKVTQEDGSVEIEIVPDPNGYLFDYYPRIIDINLFQDVQDIRKRNSKLQGKGSGPKGKMYNIFRGFIRCGYCKSSMQYVSKGRYSSGPNEGKERTPRIKCSNAHCDSKTVSYPELTEKFLEQMDEVKIENILPNMEDQLTELEKISKEQRENNKALELCQGHIENLKNLSENPSTDKRTQTRLVEWLNERLAEEEDLKNKKSELEIKYRSVETDAKELKIKHSNALDIFKQLVTMEEGDEKVALRLQIRDELRYLFDYIEVYPRKEKFIPTQQFDPGNDEDIKVRFMNARSIDRIRIKWRNIKKITVLYFTSEHYLRDIIED